MQRKRNIRASPRKPSLAKHYKRIGIPAVAAAARYQPTQGNPKASKQSDDPALDAGKQKWDALSR
jgi:hypothetical protein